MRRRSSLTPVVIGLISLASQNAAAQWHEPYAKPSTAGAFLEQQFQQVLASCGVQRLVTRVLREPRSAVPSDLQLLFKPLMDSALTVSSFDVSMPTLFAYVSSPDVSDNLANRSRLLALDLVAAPESMLPAGSSSTVYTHSCQSIVDLAANGSLHFGIPGNTARAASNSSRQVHSVVALVKGRFTSPFIDAGTEPGHELFHNLIAWEWYQRNPTDSANSKLSYLQSLNGFAIIRFLSIGANSTNELGVQAGATVPIASAGVQLRTSLTTTTQLRSTEYANGIFLRQTVLDTTRMPFPSHTSVVGVIENQRTRLESAGGASLSDGRVVSQVQYLDGVPDLFCDPNYWTPHRESGPDGDLAVSDASRVTSSTPAIPKSRCRFTITFTPRNLVPGKQVTLTYTLQHEDKARPSKPLTIATTAVQYATVESPSITPANTNIPNARVVTLQNPDRTQLNWDLSVRISEQPTHTIDRTAGSISVQDAKIVCPDSTSYGVDATLILVPNTNPHQLRVTLTMPAPGTIKARTDCHLEGTIPFQMTSTPLISEKSVPATLQIYLPDVLSPATSPVRP